MNSPAPHRETVSVDPFGAFLGMWRLLWGRQLAVKRLLLRGGLMLGFTLLTWQAIPDGRVSSTQTPGMAAAKKAYDEGRNLEGAMIANTLNTMEWDRYADAVRLYTAELAKEKAKSSPSWKQLSYLNSQLGLVLDDARQYDKALECSRKARDILHEQLTILHKELDKKPPKVDASYNSIGARHNNKDEYNKALEHYRGEYDRILELCQKSLDEIKIKFFFWWVIYFYLLILMPLTCLSVCGSMVREEAAANTLCFYTTRPLKRAEMFLLFYFGNVAWLQVLFGVLTLMLFGMAAIRGVDGLGSLLPLFLITQFLALMAWGALCSMLGMAHQRYILVGILYGLLVEIGIANIPTNIANIALSNHIHTMLAHHSPLGLVFGWSTEGRVMSIACLGIGTLLFLGIGALLFTLRELLPSQTEK